LLTLIVLERVLGIDNLVFIAILAYKLPPEQRDRARVSDKIDHFELRQSQAELESALMNSPHSRLPVIRNGRLSEADGLVHKKDVLKALLAGQTPQFEEFIHPAVRLAGSLTITDVNVAWPCSLDAQRNAPQRVLPG
jgi:hypothetical protein